MEVKTVSHDRIRALCESVRSDGINTEVQVFLAQFANLFHKCTIYLLETDGQLATSAGWHQDSLGELDEELLIEADNLTNAEDDKTRVHSVVGAGQKQGRVLIVQEEPFIEEDDLLIECGLAILGLLLARQAQEQATFEAHQNQMAQSAIES